MPTSGTEACSTTGLTMAKGDRTKAAEVVSLALTDTDGRWRNWGTWTIARRAIKALADEGWTLTPPAHRDGSQHG